MYIFGAIKTCYRSLESTEFQIHKVSSLLPLYLKSSFVSFEVNLAFVSPQIHFQCQIFNINIVSSFFLIVLEQKGKCIIFLTLQTTIRQFFIQI